MPKTSSILSADEALRHRFLLLWVMTLLQYLRLLKNLFHSSVMWKDKKKMTTILGIHLILLGIGVFLQVFKARYFGGVSDTWAPGGLD